VLTVYGNVQTTVDRYCQKLLFHLDTFVQCPSNE